MKRTQTPAVLTDKALNRFITDVLLDAREKDAAGSALMTNTLIERTVEELRAFFPGAYTETAADEGDDNVQPYPRLAGSA